MTLKKKVKIKYQEVVFCLFGRSLNVSEVTDKIGISPDIVSQGYYKSWIMKSHAPGKSSYVTRMEYILEQIKDRKRHIQQLLKDFEGAIFIVNQPAEDIYYRCYALPSYLVNEFASLGIDIHITTIWDIHKEFKIYPDSDYPINCCVKRKHKKICLNKPFDTRWNVFLVILDRNLNPDEITKTLNITPDSTSKRGEILFKTDKITRRSKMGTWRLYSYKRRNETATAHILDIYEQIKDSKNALKRILKRNDIRGDLSICFGPHHEKIFTNYFLSSELFKKFVALGLDIELMVWNPRARYMLSKELGKV